MGEKGDIGIEIIIENVKVREEKMKEYEMMIQERKERMIMVMKKEKEEEEKDILRKWGIDLEIVGKKKEDISLRVINKGEEVENMKIKDMGEEEKEYDRKWMEKGKNEKMNERNVKKVEEY